MRATAQRATKRGERPKTRGSIVPSIAMVAPRRAEIPGEFCPDFAVLSTGSFVRLGCAARGYFRARLRDQPRRTFRRRQPVALVAQWVGRVSGNAARGC